MTRLRGTVVEESLSDNRFLNNLQIVSVRITEADEPTDRWHLYKVGITNEQIEELSKQLKPDKWYAHFWDERVIKVVFPGKIFELDRYNKNTWRPAIEFGKTLNIPEEQLDFLIDG